jgi:hypothetical protein
MGLGFLGSGPSVACTELVSNRRAAWARFSLVRGVDDQRGPSDQAAVLIDQQKFTARIR